MWRRQDIHEQVQHKNKHSRGGTRETCSPADGSQLHGEVAFIYSDSSSLIGH